MRSDDPRPTEARLSDTFRGWMVALLGRRRLARTSPRSAVAIGLLMVALGVLADLVIDDPAPRLIALYPAVAIAALIGGPLAALVAMAGSAVALEWPFIDPAGNLLLADAAALHALFDFSAPALLIGLMASFDRSAWSRLFGVLLARDDIDHLDIVSALHEGVVVFSAEGRILSCNASAARVLGRSVSELVALPNAFRDWGLFCEDGTLLPPEEYPSVRALATGQPSYDRLIGAEIDGRVVWVLNHAQPLIDHRSGRVVSVVVSFTDVTERRSAERELDESRARLASIFASLHEGVLVFSPQGRIIASNPSAERLLRLSSAELSAHADAFSARRLLKEDGTPLPREDYPAVRALTTGQSCHGEIIGAPLSPGFVWLLANAEPIRDRRTGEITAAVVSLNDVTERRRAASELAESRARFASIVSNAMDAIVTVDRAQNVVMFNRAAERMFGCSAEEVLGKSLAAFVPERFRARHDAGFEIFADGRDEARAMGQGRPIVACRLDGTEFPIEASIARIDLEGYSLFTVIHRDIRERLEAELVNARLATLVKSTSAGVVTVTMDGCIETWNDGAARMFGYTAEEMIGEPVSVLSFPGEFDGGHSIYLRVSRGESVRLEAVRRRADGTPIHVLVSAAPIRDAAGTVIAGVAIFADVTDQKRNERLLEERNGELRQTLDAAGLGVWWIDVESGVMHADARSRALFAIGDTARVEWIASRFHGEDSGVFLTLRESLVGCDGNRKLVLRTATEGSRSLWLALTARLRRNSQGGEEIWGTVQDVTEQRNAEHALKQLEASRRLEALGRMTGGIAHDFNNLLTVVSGNLQLLETMPHDEVSGRYIAEALRAIESGAFLNQRLTTFARQRRLVSTITDLNDSIGAMIELLRRTVGPDISVTTDLAAALWPVRVDPAEIESAILNLAFNARDSMPDGGRIRIETRNVVVDDADVPAEDGLHGGAHVRLCVSDTGVGMTPEVRARAFEPFFTTKAPGRGTGLGLATLHGFVRQSGGFVTLYSEVGRGTVVNVHLPRAEEGAGAAAAIAPVPDIVRGAGQTILLVEDSPDVARVTEARLTDLGYRVIVASSAPQALDVVARETAIDLVFSDIMMPGGMSGVDLVRRLRAEDPSRRILLTSGFAGEIARGPDEAAFEFPVLRKPYPLADLSRAVADALTGSAQDHPRDTSPVKT